MNDRIKQVRNYFKLNQTDFGDRIGVKQSTVATNENGSRPVSDRTISAICKEFGIDRHWLETGEGDMFAENPVADLQVKDSPALRSLLAAWSKLDERNQDIFLNFMESFVRSYQDSVDEKK